MSAEREFYWLAGLLEGEGYFGLRRQGRDLVIQVGSTDLDVIERANALLNATSIKRRTLKSGKIFYTVTVCNQRHAERLMVMLRPIMSVRRAAAIDDCLAAHALVPSPKREWDHCKNGHPLAGDNLRIVQDGKYFKRRCRECGRLRQRKYRAKPN